METNSKNKNVIILSIICVLSNISYYPIMVRNGLGRQIAIAVWILLGIYLLINRSPVNTSNTFIVYMTMCVLFCINTIVVGFVNDVDAYQNHFFQPVLIASVVFFMANMLGNDIDKEGIKKICIVYFYSMAVISIPLFFIYLRGTDLSSSVYEYRYGKNEVSVLLLCALIIACFVFKPKTKIQQLIRIVAAVFFLIDITFLRARSVFLGVGLLICVLIFYKHNVSKKLRYFSIVSVIIVSIYFYFHSEIYYTFLNRIIYAGRDASNINELSSGRSETIATGIASFIENTIFGVGKRKTLDCFYVSILANYGLLGIPVIIMALIPFIWGIINLKNHNDIDLCFFTITSSIIIISIVEELAPFGPGTRCYILWLLWGLLLVNDNKESNSLPSKSKSRYIRNM